MKNHHKLFSIPFIFLLIFILTIADLQAQCSNHGLHICRHRGRHTRIVYTQSHDSCNGHSCSHHQESKKDKKEEASMGIKGGLSFANFYQTNNDLSDQSLRRAYHVGITSRFPVIPNLISVHADVLYSRKGVSGVLPSFQSRATFELSYAEIPMLLAFDIAKGVSVEGGVYGSYLIHARGTFDDSSLGNFNTEDFNTFDYGYVAGIGFRSNGVGFGARYNYGTRQAAATTALQNHIGEAKNSALQLYLVLGL